MRYKVVAWKGGLVRAIFKMDCQNKVNLKVKELKKEADKTEVFERSTLTRKVFEWKK